MTRLTKEQAVILTAQTGVLCCDFSDFHEYAERILERQIWTHEFGSASISMQLKKASREDFRSILPEGVK
jgi:hypothetical protein